MRQSETFFKPMVRNRYIDDLTRSRFC